MKLVIRPFLYPLMPAPDGGHLCLPIIGLERKDLVLKDAHGRILMKISNQGVPWTVSRLIELEENISLSSNQIADLFLDDQMIGSTDHDILREQMP